MHKLDIRQKNRKHFVRAMRHSFPGKINNQLRINIYRLIDRGDLLELLKLLDRTAAGKLYLKNPNSMLAYQNHK